MFEPLLDVETNVDPSPRHIVAIAKRNLQTLVRLYFLRHGFESMDLFIVIPLMIIGYDSLGAINDDTPPSEIEALRAALFRVIRGSMRPQEIGLLKSSMALEAGDIDQEPELAVAVRSQWPVSVVKRKEDLKFRVLTNLVESFGYMNVEEET
ncbi:hypothetical protein NW766_003607 [Fusarium irregulare]|uniref:Uncharacterized protein n=1 Tax=Fusarium irregulare TaxID=2494466 RepID=A0A9W8UC20_9HYPO|nr:hypothetical protein NW766_003607 [Fusarium irregulare]